MIILTSLAKEKKTVTAAHATGMQKLAINFKKYWQIYLLLIPALVWYLLFAYYPMAGLQLAFKTYKAKIGIWEVPGVDSKTLKPFFVICTSGDRLAVPC